MADLLLTVFLVFTSIYLLSTLSSYIFSLFKKTKFGRVKVDRREPAVAFYANREDNKTFLV